MLIVKDPKIIPGASFLKTNDPEVVPGNVLLFLLYRILKSYQAIYALLTNDPDIIPGNIYIYILRYCFERSAIPRTQVSCTRAYLIVLIEPHQLLAEWRGDIYYIAYTTS